MPVSKENSPHLGSLATHSYGIFLNRLQKVWVKPGHNLTMFWFLRLLLGIYSFTCPFHFLYNPIWLNEREILKFCFFAICFLVRQWTVPFKIKVEGISQVWTPHQEVKLLAARDGNNVFTLPQTWLFHSEGCKTPLWPLHSPFSNHHHPASARTRPAVMWAAAALCH